MPSDTEIDLTDEIKIKIKVESIYSVDSKMELHVHDDINFNQLLTNGDADNSPLLSPSALEPSDISDVNDPFTKPSSAQLDLISGHLSTSHSGSNLACQLDSLETIAERVSSHGDISKESYHLEPRLMAIQDEVASISSISSVSSPEILSPSHSGITSPGPETFLNQDTGTQLSLIQHAEDLNLHSEAANLDSDGVWTLVQDAEPTRKVFKKEEQSNTSSAEKAEDNDICMKQLDVSISASQFVFKQFGQLVPGVLTITSPAATSSNISGTNGTTITSAAIPASPVPVAIRQPPRRLKTPSLALAFPAKQNGYEVKILAQPEEQHRARYMTEGSRGSVKDTTGQGHPTVQLLGYKQKATLQVFVGSETGRVKPHGFYQACKVCGKNSTPCSERDIDGTTVIEMEFDPDADMKISVDCVGILKLRNADVEQRIGLAKSKKRSTKARLVFRVCLPKADGSTLTLQAASTQILCTQPIGQPEICRKSLTEAPVTGGEDLFIIGKNFMKGTKVLFQEMAGENSKEVLWEKAAEIDAEFFQQTHLICQVPEYDRCQPVAPVAVVVVIECSGRVSDPHSFTYTPVPITGGTHTPNLSIPHTPTEQKMEIKREVIHVPMETESEPSVSAKTMSCVSPAALELNKLIQQGQQDGDGIFKIPAGVGLPASETQDSSLLPGSGCSSPRVKVEARSISSMDITAAPVTSSTNNCSSITANAPTLVSLLKDPDNIQSSTVLQQSQQQAPSQFLQQSPQASKIPQTPEEIAKFLQESPLGQKDVMAAPDDVSQFLQQLPEQTSTTTPTSAVPTIAMSSLFPQPSTFSEQTMNMSSQVTTVVTQFGEQISTVTSPTTSSVTQFFQQNSLPEPQGEIPQFLQSQHDQKSATDVSQFLQQAPTMDPQTTVDISQFLQPTSQAETPTTTDVTGIQSEQFVPTSQLGQQTIVDSSQQATDVSQYLQQTGLEEQNTNVAPQPTTDVSQFLQLVSQASPVPQFLQATSLSNSNLNIGQQTSVVSAVPQFLQSSSAVNTGTPTFTVITCTIPSVSVQQTPIMVQQMTPVTMEQQVSSLIQHQGSPLAQLSPETIQQTSSPLVPPMQMSSDTQSIELASQAIDQMVSKCQQDDALQVNGQQTAGYMPSETNPLPSISLEDVDDILKDNLS